MFVQIVLFIERIKIVVIQNGRHVMGSRLIMDVTSILLPTTPQSYDISPMAKFVSFQRFFRVN